MGFLVNLGVSPRLQAAWDAGEPTQVRERQCGTCAYRGKFTDAPKENQDHHREWLGDMQAEEGNTLAHRCHEDPEVRCAGCTRWTNEATVLSKSPDHE